MIKNLTVFTYDAADFLKVVAKKGTESDITLYHRKDGENVYTFLSPSRFPEKVSSLTDAMYPADIAVVNADMINRDFGEVVVAMDLMGISRGYFLVSSPDKIDVIKKMTANTTMRNFGFFSGNPMELLPELDKEKHVPRFQNTMVLIDHFFKVKSVGTVALGFVLGGQVEKHQKLICSYADKEVQVRSIQVQDEDQESAQSGVRVGLALKNIDSDELERGMFLSDTPFQYLSSFNGKLEISPFSKLNADDVQEIFVSDEMRYQRGMVDKSSVQLEKPILKIKNTLVVSTPNRSPRIFGRIRIG
ncbi:MAG: EF-Tu/IF-2/RF-3 family GTPase [Candidatus Thermoplasmatota archaeon]|nr:EF-Tu/IF-2/RF-3 family GTPase [Candidatus Thermoplasmatota archaeon]